MAIKLLPDSLQLNLWFLWKLWWKKKLDKNNSKANCQIIEEAKQTLLRKQAQEILWPWTLVLSQQNGTSLQQLNKSQRNDQGDKHCLHCQRMASLSPSERLLQNRTRLSQLKYFNTSNTYFLSPRDHPSWVTRRLNGSQLKLSSLLSPSFQCVPAPSYNPTDLCCYFLPAWCCQSTTHRTAYLCLLPTPLIRKVSMISLFAWSPSPWSGKASTIFLTTLISKTEGLTLLSSQWDSSWSLSFLPLQCLLYCWRPALGILTVPVIPPEYLKYHAKMLLSSHPSLYHLSNTSTVSVANFLTLCRGLTIASK